MIFSKYTKADMEQIILCQLENLNAMHDLIHVMKFQTELLEKANAKLKEDFVDEKPKKYPVAKRSRKPTIAK